MQEQLNKTGAETSSEGPSASLSITVSTTISTPVHHSESSSTIADSTAYTILSSTSPSTSSCVHSVLVQSSPDFAVPGSSEPRPGPSSEPQPGSSSVRSSEPQPGPSSGPSEPQPGPLSGPSSEPQPGPSSGPSEPQPGPSSGPSSEPQTGPSSRPSEPQPRPSSGPSEPQPGPSSGPSSEPQPGPSSRPSSDILQTAFLLSGVGKECLSDIVQPRHNSNRQVPAHKWSLLQEDLYLSDSDDEELDYELDLNTDTSDNMSGITGPVPENDANSSDTDEDSSDEDESVSDSERVSSDNEDSDSSDNSSDEEDASIDDGDSSDDEDESSSDSDDEDSAPYVRRRPLLRASDILTENRSFTHNFISLTLHEEIQVSGKRKREDNGPGFSPKRIKLEEEMRAKRKRASEEGPEHCFNYKRRKLEESTSSGSPHARKRRASSHPDPNKYPPSIPKKQRQVSESDKLFPNPCPKACPCIAGCRVSSLRLRRIRRRYAVIQPLYKKLLNHRLLGPRNLSRHGCCEKFCCIRWFGKALPQYGLLDDYPQSDLGKEEFRYGPRKDGKGHL